MDSTFTLGNLNLNGLDDGASKYGVSFWEPGTPDFQTHRRQQVLGIDIEDASVTAVWNRIHDLEVELSNARAAALAVSGGRDYVTLAVKIGASSTEVAFTVYDGQVVVTRAAVASPVLEQGSMVYSGVGAGVALQLETSNYAHGEAVEYGPFTVDEASNFGWYQAAIPGSVPGLVTYEFTDESTGVVLNKFVMSHRSQPDLDEGNWDGVVNVAASGNGSDTSSVTDAVGSDYAGDSSVLFSDGWSEMAEALPGTPYADQAGKYDVWGRVYDSLTVPLPPRNLTTGNFTSGGSLTAASYAVVVTTIVGSAESAPSEILTISFKAPMDSVVINWDAPQFGTPTDYRVYFKGGSGDWKYFAVGSATTSYTLRAESGATTATPPSKASVDATGFRARLSLSSGTTAIESKGQAARISNAKWEPMKFFSGQYVPPAALPEGGTVEQWRVAIDAARNDGNTVPGVRVDALWMLPSDNVLEAEYLGLDLATKREWVLSGRRDGGVSGILRNTSGGAETGLVSVKGRCEAGPGDTQWVVLPMVAGGEFNVSGISLSVTVTVIPRWSFLRGSY